jgi:hypothetical protein
MLRGAPVASVPPLSRGGEVATKGHRLAGSLLGITALLVFVLTETAVAVGKPEMETITFSDTFEDEFLTEACGIDVTT